MSIKQQVNDDMKQAMRDRDAETLGTIRLLLSEIKNFEIDNGEQDDAGVEKIVIKMIKQWKDARNDYENAGRDDLVSEADIKLKVLDKYLPEQMSDEELEQIVKETVEQSDQDKPGPIIGMVKQKVGNKADGGRVAMMVNKSLK